MSDSKSSILTGVDNIIDEALGLKDIGKRPFYKHKTSCQKLCKSAIAVNIGVLLEQIYVKIILNWEKAKHHQLSAENWRFTKQKKLGADNDKEVALERAIVNVPEEVWPDAGCWKNQIPIASGFVGSRADKRRAIDLAGGFKFQVQRVNNDAVA